MRKAYLIILVLTSLVLAGCRTVAQALPTATPTVKPRPAPAIPLVIPTQAALQPVSGCTVVTQKPTPGPTEESNIPPITETDWVKGPANAKVTIIEYSDFQ